MTNQYSELQEFLDICVFNYWLKLFGLEGIKDVVCTKDGVAIHCEWDDINDTAYPFRCSYHELLSHKSWINSFGKRKDWSIICDYWYMRTPQQKIAYFLENALFPTQD
jgi:hypothetical protein